MTSATLFHSLSFHDPARAMTFLEAVGFTRASVYTDEQDPSRVLHAQYDWGGHGGVMFGSASPGSDSAGHGSCYCVVDSDGEVDAVHARALAAGGTSVRPPEDQSYGGRACTVGDPEGNQWSFGSYRGE
jgi:uncharacterized glyoxalase superfamily protein PhnB